MTPSIVFAMNFRGALGRIVITALGSLDAAPPTQTHTHTHGRPTCHAANGLHRRKCGYHRGTHVHVQGPCEFTTLAFAHMCLGEAAHKMRRRSDERTNGSLRASSLAAFLRCCTILQLETKQCCCCA